MARKLFTTLLVLTLLMAMGAGALQANNLDDLRRNQESIQQEISRYRSLIQRTSSQITSVSSEMQQLDQSIAQREQEIRQLEQVISEKEAMIESLEEELLRRQLEYARRQGAFEDRLRLIYHSGSVEFIEVLVDATDMTDFLVRFELLARIAGHDILMLEELEAERLELEEQRSGVAAQREQLSDNMGELESSKNQLAQVKSSKGDLQQKLLSEKEAAERALAEEERTNREVEKLIKDILARQLNSGAYTGGQFAWPTPGYTRVSSDYGWRIHPITRDRRMHSGIDVPAPRNTHIVSAADGRVIYAGWMGSYGNTTIIDHGGGITTLYAHQHQLGTREGAVVTKGERIGFVGTTGLSTGNHLHFEVRKNGTHTSPWPYLR